jgi:tetratricopeptide (TPR) repeat protein
MNIKSVRRWIIPALILLFSIFVSRPIGLTLVAVYFVYILWSSRSSIFSQLAIRKYRQGDRDGALTWFSKAAANSSAGGTVLLSYALVLLKAGDYDNAESQIERAAEQELAEYNKNVHAAMRGLLEWKRGNAKQAVMDLQSLADEFRNTTLFGALGSLFIAEGMMERALTFNLEAYEFDPYDSIIADNLVRTRYLRGEIEEAEEILDALIDRAPMIPEPFLNKALIHESREEWDDAWQMAHSARQCTYSYLSYFSPEEIEEICERIETEASDE